MVVFVLFVEQMYWMEPKQHKASGIDKKRFNDLFVNLLKMNFLEMGAEKTISKDNDVCYLISINKRITKLSACQFWP